MNAHADLVLQAVLVAAIVCAVALKWTAPDEAGPGAGEAGPVDAIASN